MGRQVSVLAVVIADSVLAGLAFLLAFKVQYGWEERMFTRWGHLTWLFLPYVPPLVVLPLVRIFLSWRGGRYNLRAAYSVTDDFLSIVRGAVLGSLSIVVVAALSRDQVLWQWLATWHREVLGEEELARLRAFFQTFNYSRKLFLLDCVFYVAGAGLFWALLRGVQHVIRRRGRNLVPVLLIGDTPEARALRQAIETSPRLGRKLAAFVPHIPSHEPKDILHRLKDLLARHPAEEVILSGLRISHPQLFQLITECDMSVPVEVKLLPDVADLFMRKIRADRLGDVPVFAVMEDPIGRFNRSVKRLVDLLGSAVLVGLFAPLLAMIPIFIKRESDGPIFYRQKRIGRDGRPFVCYKFRSMRDSVHDGRHRDLMTRVIRENSPAEVTPDGRKVYKERNDPRITRVGRFLRRYSLDELPQIFNVIKGDMSLVGPRPPIQYEVEEYEEWHRGRLATRPGITGLWQVSGRNEISFEDMVRLDMYYIENYSLWLDFKIMLQTIPAVFRGSGN